MSGKPAAPGAWPRNGFMRAALLLSSAGTLVFCGCGYTTRPGLPSNLRTVYVKPFANKIDVTQITSSDGRFPLYRHRMEVDLTNEIISRYQFTGLLRPSPADKADCRLEGELVQFRKDPLRYNASQQVEEWRLNLVVNLRFYDQTAKDESGAAALMWEEQNFTGDTTYFALGSNSESESAALNRSITDLARRVVERSVENW